MRHVPLLLLLGLFGCSADPANYQAPALDFSDRAPIRLAVADSRVERAPDLQAAQAHSTDALAVPLDEAVAQLLRQRLTAVGGEDYLRTVIQEVQLEEQALDTQDGIKGYFTTEPESRLEGRIAVRIERLNNLGDVLTSAETRASRSMTLPEGLDFGEHQRRSHEFLKTLINDVDRGVESNLQEHFKELITPSS